MKVQSTFSSWPPVDFIGTSADDTPIAKKNATLVGAQLRDCDSFLKAVDFYLSADVYGTAIARLGWKHKSQLERIRVPDGQGGEQIVKGNVTTFDGPDWDVISLEDFWPERGKRRIRDCKYVFHRYWMDMDDIKALAAAGEFDKAAVAELVETSTPAIQDTWASQRNLYRNILDFENRQGDKFQKRIQCVDMVGEVPDDFATDGIKMRIVTVANDIAVLKNSPFPFFHGRLDLMFFAYSPVPDMHYFHGIGKAEPMEKMTYLINRYASQKADAMDLALEPMWLVNELAGVDTQNIVTRSGKVVKVAGPVTEDNIRPFSPDLRGIPLAQNEIQQLWELEQIATGGIQDVGLGGEGPNRETATSVATRSQRVMSRQALETMIGEEAFITKLAEGMRAENRQWLTLPHQVRMIGSEATINPITGLPLPQEPTIIDHFDVAQDYKAVAVGSSQMLGKAEKRNNFMTLMQLASTNQAAVQTLNWHAMFTYAFKTFDIPNVNDFFVQQVPAVNQIADQAGVDPNAAVNQMGSAMTPGGNIGPELMQYLTQGGGQQ